MTQVQLWEALCKKNSKLKDENAKVEFTAGNLRKLLFQAYDQGFIRGKELGDTFSKMFGGVQP